MDLPCKREANYDCLMEQQFHDFKSSMLSSSNELYRHVRMRDYLLTTTVLLLHYSLPMISRILAVSAVGTVLCLIGLSQTSLIARRNDVVEQWESEAEIGYMDGNETIEYTEDGKEIEYITFEDIDAMMALEDFEMNVASGGEGGLRKLEDNTCWHGGQSNQFLWFGVSAYSENSRGISCAKTFTHCVLCSFPQRHRERSGRSAAKLCTLAFAECHLDAWLIIVPRNAVPTTVVDVAPLLKDASQVSISA